MATGMGLNLAQGDQGRRTGIEHLLPHHKTQEQRDANFHSDLQRLLLSVPEVAVFFFLQYSLGSRLLSKMVVSSSLTHYKSHLSASCTA